MSTATVGSSSTKTCDRRLSHLASTTFCWLPPLSCRTGASRPAVRIASVPIRPSTAARSARWRRKPPRPHRRRGGVEPHRLALDEDLARVGPSQPEHALEELLRARAEQARDPDDLPF